MGLRVAPTAPIGYAESEDSADRWLPELTRLARVYDCLCVSPIRPMAAAVSDETAPGLAEQPILLPVRRSYAGWAPC